MSKRKPRVSRQQARYEAKQQQQEKVHVSVKHIEALTENQAKALNSNKNQVLFGAAGTGKTFLAMYKALDALLNDKSIKRVLIFRSAVATRNIGFLPGTEAEKMAVFEAPYKGAVAALTGRGDAYEELKKKRMVEFHSTSFPRGITIDNAVVIVDEAQNMTYHELDSIMTRAGKNVTYYFSGDTKQADLPSSQSGLKDFMRVLRKMKSFNFVEFEVEDIVRGELCKEYLLAKYAEHSE